MAYIVVFSWLVYYSSHFMILSVIELKHCSKGFFILPIINNLLIS